MIINTALKWATVQLQKAGVDSPEFDVEVLLAYALSSPSPQSSPIKGEEEKNIPSPRVGEGRVRGQAWLLAHPEHKLTRGQLQKFRNFVRRRVRREPLAYIVGHKEFYGLEFVVNRQVMVPRPETEMLVEEAIRAIRYSLLAIRNLTVVDIGTGSGCIIISLAKFLSNSQYPISNIQFFATDISTSALRVARANARRHGVAGRITFLRGNLLEPLKNVILNGAQRSEGSRTNVRGADKLRDSSAPMALQNDRLVIVANLPYLPTAEWRASAPEIKNWEPRGALDGGKDGLKYYWELFGQIQQFVILNGAPAPERSSVRGLTPRSEESLTAHMRLPVGKAGVRSFTAFRMTILCELCPHQIPAFKKLVLRYFPRAVVEARGHIAVVRIN